MNFINYLPLRKAVSLLLFSYTFMLYHVACYAQKSNAKAIGSDFKNIPYEVRSVLNRSGSNRVEFEKVIDHYTRSGDDEKLKAVFFLIGNCSDKQSIIWKNRDDYQPLYNYIKTGANANQTLKRWDSLKNVLKIKKETVKDVDLLKSGILINNIDLAFASWKNMPWGRFYNFDQFCEYILPYRVAKEPLDNWRPFLYDKLKWIPDSLKNKNDIREACKYINDYVHKHHRLIPTMGEVPTLASIDAFNNPAGVCADRLILIIDILRTFGIPCALDFTPQYANWAGGHSWITLIDTTGMPISFSGGDLLKYPSTNKMPMGFGTWTASKIYRQTFARNSDFDFIFYRSCIDVTTQYDMPIGEVTFNIKNVKEEDDVFLFAFGHKNKMIPVGVTQCDSGNATFKNLGLNCVYFPGIYNDDNEIVPLLNPVFLDSLNTRFSYDPNKINTHNVTLTAKYPDDGSMLEFGKQILGAKIEGSNSESFQNCKLLHTIDKIPYHFVDIAVNSKEKFRYVRYTASDSGYIRLAELAYYSDTTLLKGKMYGKCPKKDCNPGGLARLQDKNFYTVMNADPKSFVIYDFGEPRNITKIKYVQRSRINFVEPGSTYELFYFDYGWHSLGVKTSSESQLQYEKVPKNSLLVLVKPESKEDRIFIYENNKQVWK